MPHYLRFAAALVLAAALPACARSVGPADGDEPDSGATSACPASAPHSDEACSARMVCAYPYGDRAACEVTTCTCAPGDAGALSWGCQLGCIVGPLPPPELATEA